MSEGEQGGATHDRELARAERLLWIGVLLLTPVSASPLLPFGSGTQVRPLAFLPALLLLGLAAFRILFRRQTPRLPDNGGRWLMLFVLYVTIAGLIQVAFLPDDSFKGQTPMASFTRALATLAVGLVFYLTARLNIRTLADIRRTIRWLFLGLSASIALALVQVYAIIAGGDMSRQVQAVTDIFAIRNPALANRAQGMTFEPSWLATQIILLMLPALVARIISRQSYPDAPLDQRNVLIAGAGLGVALVGLLCAGSRFGIVAALLMLLMGCVMALWRGRVVAALVFMAVLAAGGGGIAALGSVSAGAGATYVLGPFAYLTDAPQAAAADPDLTSSVTEAFALAGRAAAAQAAFNLWLDHPVWGVSLGNNYRYFERYAPDWAYESGLFTIGSSEGAGWTDPNSPEKGNAKVSFLRLLSETGVIGLALYGLFFWRQVFAVPGRDNYYVLFRLAAAAALLFAGFNQDSFADPAVWIVLALCAAMGGLQVTSPQTPFPCGNRGVTSPS